MLRRKPKGITARLRASKRRRLDRHESAAMQEVRERDVTPRFPLAGAGYPAPPYDECQPTEVSHSEHRGMGGDPTGKRTQRQTMILLSRKRHTGHHFSVDQGGLKWTPCTKRGSDGPIQWWVNADYLPADFRNYKGFPRGHWILLAIEMVPHDYWPMTPEQQQLLSLIG